LRFLVGGVDRDRVDILDVPQERAKAELRPLEEYKKSALHNRPELKALEHAVKAMEAKVEMRESGFFPDLALAGEFRYGWTPGRPDIDNWTLKDDYNYGPSWGAGLVLSYDLDFGLDIYKLDQAKAELAALSTDQQAALDGIMLEVEKTFLATAAARDGLAALEKSRRSLKGWIAAVIQGHAAGLNSAKDVRDALKEYFAIMGSIYKMTHDYNVGLAELRKVTGAREAGDEYKAPSGSQNP
ncbi:MAG: TolC family protein, partial [Deltaproteobacteria bacterium]|nr:TolC family protein [Deltaproteobacteria bacterium]